jgi:cold shock CspA family protein
MLGKITRILESKGFGFIWSVMEEKHFFFHKDTVSPESPIPFDKMKVGNTVSFEPSSKIINGNEKGRAESVVYLN